MKTSRRIFLRTLGGTTAGLLVSPRLLLRDLQAAGSNHARSFVTQVAVTQAVTYNRSLVKQKVQHLFDSLGGIGDIVSAGKKVAIKINLTGGTGDADHMWTHPEVLRAVGELILDSGVSPSSLYIVESLWSTSSYNNYGFLAVQQGLGAQMVDLNGVAPYASFATKSVGSQSINFSSFTMNRILEEVDVYVSIPKMKQHYEAGVTASLKNQVGAVPKQLYTTPGNTGRRDALHTKDGTQSSTLYLPRSICDLSFARPVHLAVIDAIKNARGGEGTWNPTFQPCEDHMLLAGKDPVATDSICAHAMGNDPEAATFHLPSGGQCENYLEVLHQKGMGTNQLAEIQAVGDGAGLVSVPRPRVEPVVPIDATLYPNYPNPFNPSTTLRLYLPANEHVIINVYDIQGREIETLLDGSLSRGLHEIYWEPHGIASGTYLCVMQAGNSRNVRKLVYEK
jgi:uncharacterized protein (DUF362 family)